MNEQCADSCRTVAETVIDGGYCIGCGACAVVAASPVQLRLDACGRIQAHVPVGATLPRDVSKVCPFSEEAVDETQIAAEVFGDVASNDPELGRYLALYAGHVAEHEYRQRGSSGGMGTWILTELLRRGMADAVIHSRPQDPDEHGGLLYGYQISRSIEQVRLGAKSHYHPVTLAHVMQEVKRVPGRYVLVGIPCFIKAARLLMRSDPILRERIAFCIALFCGHLKSLGFAQYLGWEAGIDPRRLKAIDFRVKLPDRPASSYAIEAVGGGGGHEQRATKPVVEMVGSDWGMGFFKYKACDYCDDVAGETADLAIGDAWLPRYAGDHRGTNVLIVRHREIQNLIEKALREQRLVLDPLSRDAVYESQQAAFRHRRSGLSYRIALAEQAGQWCPPKRIAADLNAGDKRFRRIQRLRIELRDLSHVAWAEALRRGTLSHFMDRVRPSVDRYHACYRRTRTERLVQWLRQAVKLRSRLRRLLRFRLTAGKTS